MTDPIIPGPTAPGPTEPAKPAGMLPHIRTYAADMGEAIRDRGATLSSIINAERTQPHAPETPKGEHGHLRMIAIGAVILIIFGVSIVGAAWSISRPADTPALSAHSIIFPNKTVSVDAGAAPLVPPLTAVRDSAALSLGEIEWIAVQREGGPLGGADLARALGAPEAFAREVGDVMVGIHSFDRNQPFIILTITAYDRAFGAALGWEREMGGDLGAFFAPVGAEGLPPPLTFTDAVIQNLDVRKSAETWPILYAFPRRDLMIITTNEFTLREILTRLGGAR